MFPGKKQGPFRKAVKEPSGQMMFEFGQNVANLGMKGLAFGLVAAEILHAVGATTLAACSHPLSHVGDVTRRDRLQCPDVLSPEAEFATTATRTCLATGRSARCGRLASSGARRPWANWARCTTRAALEAAHVRPRALFPRDGHPPSPTVAAANRTDIPASCSPDQRPPG